MHKASLEAVEELARRMEPEKVYEEFDKAENEEVREVVRDVIEDKATCKKCGNDMLRNADEGKIYCPLGCFEF